MGVGMSKIILKTQCLLIEIQNIMNFTGPKSERSQVEDITLV